MDIKAIKKEMDRLSLAWDTLSRKQKADQAKKHAEKFLAEVVKRPCSVRGRDDMALTTVECIKNTVDFTIRRISIISQAGESVSLERMERLDTYTFNGDGPVSCVGKRYDPERFKQLWEASGAYMDALKAAMYKGVKK